MNCAEKIACDSVLVIDDEEIIIDVIAEIMGRSVNVFDTATDSLEGYAKLLQRDYDRIFIDVMLPGMDGLDLLRLIKQIKPNLLRSIIFIAGGTESEYVRKTILSNGCRIIDKPFKVQEFFSVL